eukprot:TRINITY_DN4627_c0_g2_i2.p1 TRINITY_DN4627_c0_g2~~TRINITY_DN4627_c0_g2_i2.p1  ORF type:complete len:197 (+),score=56.90 TRINITY_DN4627_c0_g2_i2:187-777(+)
MDGPNSSPGMSRNFSISPGQSPISGRRFLSQSLPSIPGRDILVAVDGSLRADKAFEEALKSSGPNDKLHILHVASDNRSVASACHGVVASPVEVRSQRLLSKYGTQCSALRRQCSLESMQYVGGKGAVGSKIIDHAKEVNASKVFIGENNLSPIAKMLFGSVSNQVKSNCKDCNFNLITVKDKSKGESAPPEILSR